MSDWHDLFLALIGSTPPPAASMSIPPSPNRLANVSFDTPLTPAEETQFQTWKAKYASRDSGYDYDLRGAFKAGLTPDPVTGHWPDTFKKPNHPTFSVESKYAAFAPDKAGRWSGDTYIPPGKH